MGVDEILAGIQAQSAMRALRITDHAREEMEAEAITLAEVQKAMPEVGSSRITQTISVDLVVYSLV
jgi:hypothetical protein